MTSLVGSLLGAAELDLRVLAFLGPSAALAARPGVGALAGGWALEALAALARTGVWAASLGPLAATAQHSRSLHVLLDRLSPRSAGPPCAHPPGASAAAANPGSAAADASLAAATSTASLFDAVFVLLASAPRAAEESPALHAGAAEGAVEARSPPLIAAARRGLVSVAWLLARHCTAEGGGLNRQDAMGFTALRYAIVNKDERLCRCLLSFPGLDLEMLDSRGDTPLLQAVSANVPTACRMLLARGANAAYASRGQTALDLAESLGYDDCAAVLMELGAPRGSGCAPHDHERAAWSDCDDDDLGCSGSDPDPELHEALRESRRSAALEAAARAGKKRSAAGVGNIDSPECEDGTKCAEASQRQKCRRWDSGGLFIKSRGGQARTWQG